MNTSKSKIMLVFCLLTAPLAGLVYAQSHNLKEPAASPTPQTNFGAEHDSFVQSQQEMRDELTKNRSPLEQAPTKIVLGDESPGTSGVVLIKTERKLTNAKINLPWLVYSELAFPGIYSKKSRVFTVINSQPSNSIEEQFFFSPYSSTDAGYIADPLWLNNRTIVMKCGVYNDYNGYSLYVFDRPTKRIFRLCQGISNPLLTVSPDHRYMTYLVGGDSIGSSDEGQLLQLHVWDAQLNHDTKVATNLRLQGSYNWKSDHELIYSQEEKRGAVLTANSYIWDATTNKSSLWLRDCQAPVLSPNALYVVYAAPLDVTKDFAPDNSTYVVQNLKTGKKTVVERIGLGKYDPNRQLIWSADSRLVFSILRLWTDTVVKGHRLFVYDRASRKPLAFNILKPQQTATLLASSSKGERLLFLRQRILSHKLNAVYDWDYGFSVDSVDTNTGKVTTLLDKKHVLGLSAASIVFDKDFLKD